MWRWKYGLLAVLFVIAPFCMPTEKPPFFGLASEYEVWAGANSSAGRKVLCEGEYAIVDVNALGGVACESKRTAESLLSQFGATVLFSETTCGVTSYYAAADLPFGVEVNGVVVNLQVAVRTDGSVKVGSPIIFGSY